MQVSTKVLNHLKVKGWKRNDDHPFFINRESPKLCQMSLSLWDNNSRKEAVVCLCKICGHRNVKDCIEERCTCCAWEDAFWTMTFVYPDAIKRCPEGYVYVCVRESQDDDGGGG